MQSYRDGNGPIAGPSGSGGGGGLSGVLSNRGREDEIGRYKDKYEESMNPFEAFKGRVSGV
jgi:homeobox protein cut-like